MDLELPMEVDEPDVAGIHQFRAEAAEKIQAREVERHEVLFGNWDTTRLLEVDVAAPFLPLPPLPCDRPPAKLWRSPPMFPEVHQDSANSSFHPWFPILPGLVVAAVVVVVGAEHVAQAVFVELLGHEGEGPERIRRDTPASEEFSIVLPKLLFCSPQNLLPEFLF